MKKRIAGLLSAIMLVSAVAASASEIYYAENRYVLQKQIYGNGEQTEVIKTGDAELVSDEGAEVIEANVTKNIGGIAIAQPEGGWGFTGPDSCLTFDIKIVDRPNYMRVHITGTPAGGYWGDYGILNQPVSRYGKETKDGYYSVKIPLSSFKLTPAQIDSLTNKLKIEAYDEMGTTSGKLYVRNIAIEQPVVTAPETQYTTKKEIVTNLTDTIPDTVSAQSKSSPKPTLELADGAIKITSDQEYFGINVKVSQLFASADECISFKVKTIGRGTGMRVLLRGYPEFNNYQWTEKGFSNIDIAEYGILGADGYYDVKIPVKEFGNTYEELSQLDTLELSTRMNYDNIAAGDFYIKDIKVENCAPNPLYSVQKVIVDNGVAATAVNVKKNSGTAVMVVEDGLIKVSTEDKLEFFGIELSKPNGGWFTSNDEYLCFDVKISENRGTKMRVRLNGFSSGSPDRGLLTKDITPYAELGDDGFYHVMLPLSIFNVTDYTEANKTSKLEISTSRAWNDTASGYIWIKNVSVEKLAGTKAELAVKNADETAEITSAAVSETVVADVKYINNLASDVNYALIFSSYDADGTLIRCDIQSCVASTGNIGTLRSTYTIPEGAATLKAMLWDTMSSISPLTETIHIEVK